MITNEDYIQWRPLIKKIAWKHRYNVFGIELDDLEQIGAIGLINGFDTYIDEKSSLKSWLYNSIERSIFREYVDLNRYKRKSSYNSVSLNQPTSEDDDLTLEDTIADENVDVEGKITDELLEMSYKKEINLHLSGREREVVYRTLFKDKTYADLSREYGVSRQRIRDIQHTGFRHLIYKSKMIREKWIELKERDLENKFLNMYRNPERICIDEEIINKLGSKYKYEIELLNFIQEIFDELADTSKMRPKVKEFYLIWLKELIPERDLILLDRVVFHREYIENLLNEDFSYDDILGIKSRIRKHISKNKERSFQLWNRFNSSADMR